MSACGVGWASRKCRSWSRIEWRPGEIRNIECRGLRFFNLDWEKWVVWLFADDPMWGADGPDVARHARRLEMGNGDAWIVWKRMRKPVFGKRRGSPLCRTFPIRQSERGKKLRMVTKRKVVCPNQFGSGFCRSSR